MGDSSEVHIGGEANLVGSAIGGRDAIVAGTGQDAATARTPPALDELRRSIAELATALEESGGNVTQREELTEAVDELAREADKLAPNRHVLSGILGEVGKAATGIGALAHTVTAVQQAVAALFGG